MLNKLISEKSSLNLYKFLTFLILLYNFLVFMKHSMSVFIGKLMFHQILRLFHHVMALFHHILSSLQLVLTVHQFVLRMFYSVSAMFTYINFDFNRGKVEVEIWGFVSRLLFIYYNEWIFSHSIKNIYFFSIFNVNMFWI